jgi:hypothetical protein
MNKGFILRRRGKAHPVFAISALFLGIGKYYLSKGVLAPVFKTKY